MVSFSPSTLGKQRFETVPFSNRSTLESVFETIRFRTVVVWTVAVSGTKQYRFRLKTVYCGRGPRGHAILGQQRPVQWQGAIGQVNKTTQ